MSDDYGTGSASRRRPDYSKDPDSTVDYTFNHAAELGTDTIDTCDFLLPDGMTEVSTGYTDTTATIFASGGTAGTIYRITNRITTVGGRTHDKTINILVSEQ